MGAKGVMIRVTTPPQTGKRGVQNRIKVLVDVDIITRLVSLCVFQALSAISMPIIFDARVNDEDESLPNVIAIAGLFVRRRARAGACMLAPQNKRSTPPYGSDEILRMRLPLNSAPYGSVNILNMGHVLKNSALWL